MTPQFGFGVGVILISIGWLTTQAPLMAENRRLRRELALRDQHPALRPHVPLAASSPTAQEAWETLGDHTDQALAVAAHEQTFHERIGAVSPLRPVAPVIPIQRQGVES